MESQNCIHESANLELDAEIARFMCLPEVQPGHLAYWYSPTACGWTAYAGAPNRPSPRTVGIPGVAGMSDQPCYVYRYGPEGASINSDNGLREIPHYSSDIAAAWQVVEYVRSLMYWFCLFDQRETPDRWRASFCRVAIPTEPIDAFGSTPAEA